MFKEKSTNETMLVVRHFPPFTNEIRASKEQRAVKSSGKYFNQGFFFCVFRDQNRCCWLPCLLLLGLPSSLLQPRCCHPLSVAGTVSVHHSLIQMPTSPNVLAFREASAFRNGENWGSTETSHIHVSMTLDANYLRGTMLAILSILQHSTCPDNFEFHFPCAHFKHGVFSNNSTFPYLHYKVYRFDSKWVWGKISKLIWQALDQPLN